MSEIKVNYHTHTTYCDGNSTPEEIAEKAVSLGMTELGFSGHSYTSFDESYCMSKEDMRRYFDEINGLKERYEGRLEILCGIEMDIFSDREDYDLPWDYVIGSCHYIKKGGEYIPVDESEDILTSAASEYYGGDIYQLAEDYYREVSEVHDVTGCDIVGHFDLITKFNEESQILDDSEPAYEDAWMSALEKLTKDEDLIFEINTGAMSRGYRTEPYPSSEILAELGKRKTGIILSSDSHDKSTLLYGFEKARRLAESAGLTPLDHLALR